MLPRDRAYLIDIEAHARSILEFTQEMTIADFTADYRTQLAVSHLLIRIGEITKRLTPELKELHPHIPWRDTIRNRDFIAHHYERLDLNELWKTVTQDIPSLHTALLPLLSTEQTDTRPLL